MQRTMRRCAPQAGRCTASCSPCHRPVAWSRARPLRVLASSTPSSTATSSSSTASTSTTTSRALSAAPDYFASDRRPVILFDGVCNLCNGAVNLMLDLDPSGSRFRLAALQSPAGRVLLKRCNRSPDDISSIVLVEAGAHYIKSDAVLKIAEGLQTPFPFLALLGFPVPPFLRDAAYDAVANNRYSLLGRTQSCRLSDPSHASRFLAD